MFNKKPIKCKKNTYDIANNTGNCPENCEHGAWNNGICGAECLTCLGTLYLTKDDKVYCDSCGYVTNDNNS